MMIKLKYVLLLFFAGITSLLAQEKLGEADVENFEEFITEVYGDSVEDVILNNKKSISFYKGILDRLVFYKASSFPKSLTLINLNEVYKIKDYNSNIDFKLPNNFIQFNPYKFKLNTYNKKTIYYYSENGNYIIGLLPLTQS